MSLPQILSQLSGGMVRTVGIFFLTLIFSLPLGLVISFGQGWAKNPVLKNLFKIYISVMRGTPLMLQLMVFYLAPIYLFKMTSEETGALQPSSFPFPLNYAAYFAEIYRSGIESMPVGQYEAAKLLGYSRSQTFFRIIFPQVVKRILPSVTNEVITLVKDHSLAFAVAYMEMFTIAKQIAASKTTFVPFVVAAIFYYVFNLIVAVVMENWKNAWIITVKEAL